MKITAKVETVSPKTAAAYLATMVANRKLKKDSVVQYANDMINGKWLVSPQGIAFDEEGRLFEGQHRLHAVIRADLSVPMLVLRGFPVRQSTLKTMDVVDGGVLRSLADRLKLMGAYHGNPNLGSAAARQIAAVVVGVNSRAARKVSLASTLEILSIWKREMHAVCSVLDRPLFKPFRNGPTVAAFSIAAVADLKLLDRDMGRLTTGANLDADSPLLELRNLHFSPVAWKDRECVTMILAALYCTWKGLPGKAFMKEPVRAEALEYFRAAQPARYAKVESLFHSRGTEDRP